MIRRSRGAEPPALGVARSKALATLRTLRASRPLTSKDFSDSYRNAFEELYRTQGGTCCFCEYPEQEYKSPVEHFRPKTLADHGQGAGPVEGYWWLAYSWQNLTFACQTCNEKYKDIHFPLAAGSTPLTAEDAPPGAEVALLIHPFDEDPGLWIEFVPDSLASGWMPQARGGQPKDRGEATIRVLGLARRQDLIDARNQHVRHRVEPAVQRIQSALAGGDPAVLATTWQSELSHLFYDGAPFQALSRDVLCHYIPEAERARFGLTFPAHVALP